MPAWADHNFVHFGPRVGMQTVYIWAVKWIFVRLHKIIILHVIFGCQHKNITTLKINISRHEVVSFSTLKVSNAVNWLGVQLSPFMYWLYHLHIICTLLILLPFHNVLINNNRYWTVFTFVMCTYLLSDEYLVQHDHQISFCLTLHPQAKIQC